MHAVLEVLPTVIDNMGEDKNGEEAQLGVGDAMAFIPMSD